MSEDLDDLPPGWMSVAIGDVTETKVDQRGPAGKGEFTYVDISSVNNATKVISDAKQVPIKNAPSRARQRIRSGDVLVSMTRPNLNAVAKVPTELDGAIASTGFDVLRSRGVEPNWLFAHVQSKAFIDSMSDLVRGALYPAVNSKEVRDYRIPLPPLLEQRRIVAKIEALQARSRKAREALDAIPPLLEQFRQSVLAAAFRGNLTADWREQHPDVEPAGALLERIRAERRRKWEQAEIAKIKADSRKIKNDKWKSSYQQPRLLVDDLNDDLPDTWEQISFDEVSASALYGPRFGKEEYISSGVPTVRITDMDHNGNISKSMLMDAPRVTILEHQRDHFCLKHCDLLITRTGATIGKCALFDGRLGDAVASAYLIRYRLTVNSVLPQYLLYFLLSPAGQNQLVGGSRAVAQPNINTSSIARISVPLTPLEEQAVIVSRLDKAFVQLEALAELIRHSSSERTSLDQSILAKAFRGELVHQDPDDEPASMLLERIRAEQADNVKVRPASRGNR